MAMPCGTFCCAGLLLAMHVVTVRATPLRTHRPMRPSPQTQQGG